MGRIKEELINKEYKDMNKTDNTNIRDYLLTIESEFIPETYERDNYYLLKYIIFDLKYLFSFTISEKVLASDLEQTIPKQLAKIMHETFFSIDEYRSLTYKALINNRWLDNQYLFTGILIKSEELTLDNLTILPSSEKAIIHYLKELNDNITELVTEIAELRSETNSNLNNIDKALDLMNYLTQG